MIIFQFPIEVHAPYENSCTPIQYNQSNMRFNKEASGDFIEQMHAEQNPVKDFQTSDWVHRTEIGISNDLNSIYNISFPKERPFRTFQ